MINNDSPYEFNQKTLCYQCGQIVYNLVIFDEKWFRKENEICWLHMSCLECKLKRGEK